MSLKKEKQKNDVMEALKDVWKIIFFELHNELFNQTYKHNFYTNFNIF